MVSLHKVVLLDILFIAILCKYALEVYIKNEQTLYSTHNFLTEKL